MQLRYGPGGRYDAGRRILGNGHGSMVTGSQAPSGTRPDPGRSLILDRPTLRGHTAPLPRRTVSAVSGSKWGPTLMPSPARTCDDRVMPAASPRAASSLAPDPEEPPQRKLYRSADGRLLGGVARGLAGHLGLPVAWVRFVFLGLFFADGLGALLYAVFWIVVPLGVGGVDGPRSVFATAPDGTRRLRKPDKGQVFALIALLIGALIFVGNVDMGSKADRYIWPTLLIGAGSVLVWRQADNARRARWMEVGSRRRVLHLARGLAGVALVGLGLAGFMVVRGSAAQLGNVLTAAIAVLTGIALLVSPISSA